MSPICIIMVRPQPCQQLNMWSSRTCVLASLGRIISGKCWSRYDLKGLHCINSLTSFLSSKCSPTGFFKAFTITKHSSHSYAKPSAEAVHKANPRISGIVDIRKFVQPNVHESSCIETDVVTSAFGLCIQDHSEVEPSTFESSCEAIHTSVPVTDR